MRNKIRHIRVRVTEAQFRWLTSVLIEERRTKSQVIREAINNYLVENSVRTIRPTEDKKK